MGQKNDQIFQLSLTEIVFCIVFILLLLLGYLVVQEQEARRKAEQALTQVQNIEKTQQRLETVRIAFTAELKNSGNTAPDDVITKLLEAEKTREETIRLRKQVEDLDAQITALSEIRELLNKEKGGGTQLVKGEIESAISLQSEVRHEINKQREKTKDYLKLGEGTADAAATRDVVKLAMTTANKLREEVKTKLGQDLSPKAEEQLVVELVDAAKSFAELSKAGVNVGGLKKENSDLRGQVAFMKKRLDARGGRDYPPCWADENGKVEFLFSIELRSDSVVMAPAWPMKRDADANALPGVLTAITDSHAHNRFPTAIQGVFNWSKNQDPECRHYVQLKSLIQDAVQSDRARLMVENYFYKVELRR